MHFKSLRAVRDQGSTLCVSFSVAGGNFVKKFDLPKKMKGGERSQESKEMTEKSRLFDLLMHDLSGPLSVASTSTENLLQKLDRYGPLTDHQKRTLDRILRNVRKAQTLLHEMVEIFRSEEGLFQSDQFQIERTVRESLMDALEITVPHAVEELLCAKNQVEFQKILNANGIFVEFSGKYCESPFCHDQKKVQQVLRNLISNALKYRRRRMSVCIKGDTDLFVSVEDDGVGIPEKEQEVIFERFVRLNDKRYAGVPGLGLGLTGVKALLQAMGGEITLESREGFGTCFTVRIPPLDLQKEEKIGKESILNGKRILAIDDEPDILTVLEEEILEASPGCEFDKATTYHKAAELLRTQNYDVVILDIMGVRGFDLLELAVSRDFRVAVLTANALNPEALKRSFEMKARAYLPKEKMGEIVPFLEDVLMYDYLPGWKGLLKKLEGYFDNTWGESWQKPDAQFWDKFNKKTARAKL
jgi:CheY-like chemotaxis protein